MNDLRHRLAVTLSSLALSASLDAAPPAAPSELTFALSDSADRGTLEWTDNADDETGFQFEVTIGDGTPFINSGIVAPNVESNTFRGFSPGTPVSFRLRAIKPLEGGGAGELEVSEWSNSATVVTVNFLSDTPIFTRPGLDFSFRLQTTLEIETFQILEDLPSWLTYDESEFLFTATNPPAGNFTIPFSGSSGVHVRTNNISFDITNNFLSSAVTGTPGEDFSYQLKADFVPDSMAIDGSLPSWLSFEESSMIFTAVDPPEGNYRVSFSGTSGDETITGFLFFNIINLVPTVTGAFDALSLNDDPTVGVDPSAVFEDPDFIRAAAVKTDFGDITLGFYEGFPVTVENFFAYASSDAWDGAFFHRMARLGNGENFVLQGGGFKAGSEAGSFERVTQLPPIVNEFSSTRPNFSGTISMAKLGGNPDSATNQFFISLNDNRAILDGQNGGFTVFGRAANIEAANEISALPRSTYPADFGDFISTFDDWPLEEIDGDSPTPGQLASMSDVIEIPTLSYSVDDGGDGLVTVEVPTTVGGSLMITPTGLTGTTQLTITATDLDGASVSATLPITVTDSYSIWALREMVSGPEDRSDGGILTNFEEYAYGGDPSDSSDDIELLPFGGISDDGFGTFTFRHRDLPSDLVYSVESSANLLDWDPVWTTSDGFEADRVSRVEDDGAIKVLTIKAGNPGNDESKLFYRLLVESPSAVGLAE